MYKKYKLGQFQEAQADQAVASFKQLGYVDIFQKVLPSGKVEISGSLWEASEPIPGYKFQLLGFNESSHFSGPVVLGTYDTLDEAKDHEIEYECSPTIQYTKVKKVKV